ncbi:hypothetical protein VTK26DRAFT_7409 [Humicola hyalothermophila]
MSLRLPTRTSTFTRTLVRPLIRTASLRTAPRFHRRSGGALPLSLGLTSGLGLVALHRQQPLRFDTAPTTTAQSRPLSSGREPRRKDLLDPDTVKELSGGSLAGEILSILFFFFFFFKQPSLFNLPRPWLCYIYFRLGIPTYYAIPQRKNRAFLAWERKGG